MEQSSVSFGKKRKNHYKNIVHRVKLELNIFGPLFGVLTAKMRFLIAILTLLAVVNFMITTNCFAFALTIMAPIVHDASSQIASATIEGYCPVNVQSDKSQNATLTETRV